MIELLVVGLIVISVVAIFWFGWTLMKKRREGLQAVAQELNLEFFPKGNPQLQPLLANLSFFEIGDRSHISNLMQGVINHRGKSINIAVFDYTYAVLSRIPQDRNDYETYSQTVLFLHDKSLNIPAFTLYTETAAHKIANFFGFRDINFEQFPNFSKRYRLLSEQEQAIVALFQTNLIKYYENLKQRICTETNGPYIVIFPSTDGSNQANNRDMIGRWLKPEEIKPYLKLGLHLLDLLEENTKNTTR